MTPPMLSPLGRSVDNWWDYDKDAVLSALYESTQGLFGSNTPVSKRLLAEKIQLDEERVVEVSAALAHEGFLDADEASRGFCKLTANGAQEVHRLRERI